MLASLRHAGSFVFALLWFLGHSLGEKQAILRHHRWSFMSFPPEVHGKACDIIQGENED